MYQLQKGCAKQRRFVPNKGQNNKITKRIGLKGWDKPWCVQLCHPCPSSWHHNMFPLPPLPRQRPSSSCGPCRPWCFCHRLWNKLIRQAWQDQLVILVTGSTCNVGNSHTIALTAKQHAMRWRHGMRPLCDWHAAGHTLMLSSKWHIELSIKNEDARTKKPKITFASPTLCYGISKQAAETCA